MPIQVYVDESVSEGQQFVFAGFIGAAEQWAAFSDRWHDVVGQTQPFKFSEFASANKRFGPETTKGARLSQLIATMKGAGFTRISVAIGIPPHAEMSERWDAIELAFPYCYAFQLMIVAVALELLEQGHRGERFEIFFDEQVILGPRAKRWYPLIRELCVSEEIRSILPAEPFFRTDDEVMALQAADLYAGLVRSRKGEENARRDAILSPILVKLSGVKVADVVEMRAQSQIARECWDNVTSANDIDAGMVEAFAPIATRLKKSLDAIGGDAASERTLAPLFAAVNSMAPVDPDGLNWVRQELAEVTRISGHSQVLLRETKQQALEAAMLRYGITKDQLGRTPRPTFATGQFRGMPDEELIRAIARLDQGFLDTHRKKLAKKRRKQG